MVLAAEHGQIGALGIAQRRYHAAQRGADTADLNHWAMVFSLLAENWRGA